MSLDNSVWLARPQLPYQPRTPAASTIYTRTIAEASRRAEQRATAHPQNQRLVKDMALLDYMISAYTWLMARDIAADPSFEKSVQAGYAQDAIDLEPELHALLFSWRVACGDQGIPPPHQGLSTPAGFSLPHFADWCPLEHAPAGYEWLAILQYIPHLSEITFMKWQAEVVSFLANVQVGSHHEPPFEGDEQGNRAYILGRFQKELAVHTSFDS